MNESTKDIIKRCHACGTIMRGEQIKCVLCGQMHDAEGLAALARRCAVFETER